MYIFNSVLSALPVHGFLGLKGSEVYILNSVLSALPVHRFLVLKGSEVYIFDRGPASVEDWCQGERPIKYKVNKYLSIRHYRFY